MSKSEHIAIVGAGLMGHGLAQVFASKGHEVRLTDVNEAILAGAPEQIRNNLVRLANGGMGALEDIDTILKNILTVKSLKETVEGARFVVEAIAENLSLKQQLFREMEVYCSPNTVLASNTSVISITEIASKAKRKERIVGTHFWNPPYLIPLVEVVPGNKTSSEVVDYTYELLKTAGKHPVKVKRDVPGFVGNRLQHALWREAISIVEQGIADAATVDEVIKQGFGIRLPILGPLETADMVGLDLTLQIHDYILQHIERSPGPSPLLREKVKKGELGFKTGKGFQQWSPEEIDQSRKNLVDYLIKWNREQEKR
jgi:3-hydroxybutyryl-CoA dehydrogenase